MVFVGGELAMGFCAVGLSFSEMDYAVIPQLESLVFKLTEEEIGISGVCWSSSCFREPPMLGCQTKCIMINTIVRFR